MNEQLQCLLQRLDEPAHRYAELNRYYAGRQELAFLSPEAKLALGNRFGRMSSNLPRIAVTALAERLRITGFSGADVWADWIRNDLDQTSAVAHREALLLGDAYVLVWSDRFGRPRVTVESAQQVAVLTDPGSRQIVAAIKRWEDTRAKTTEAVMYLPDSIVRLRADQQGAVANGFRVIDELANPIGTVPCVNLRNSDRIVDSHYGMVFDWGVSEIDDLTCLVDGLNKLLTDLMVAAEYTARPRRFAVGVELTEEPVLDAEGNPTGEMVETNPIPEGNRAMISENEQAKFGQLPGADLTGYENAVGVLMQQIMAVSALPEHMVGITTDNPASADALRAAEASLTARAEARQQTFGRSWEQVARLMVAVSTGQDPNLIDDIRVQWADAATRSAAQEADAVTKLYQSGLLPASYALKKLGYSDDEIAEIRSARAQDNPPTANVTPLAS
jgi:hypothetical protein